MSDLLPTDTLPRITQKTGRYAQSDLLAREAVLIITGPKPAAAVWRSLPAGSQLRKLIKSRKINDLAAHTRLDNKSGTAIYVATTPAAVANAGASDSYRVLSYAGKLATQVLADNPSSVALLMPDSDPDRARLLLKALVAALAARQFQMPAFKSTPAKAKARTQLKQISIVGHPERIDFSRTLAETRANNLARWLTALPPNKLDADAYRSIIQSLSKQHDWQFRFLDEKQLAKLGAGAFLAVSQGNARRDAGIVHLRYRPGKTSKTTQPSVALVGKGIIFDTGGTNLKPFKAMLDMHHDMAGSAVALATLAALTELQWPEPVDCWLAITENRLSNEAYKSRDIVTASNGVTIEVIHTDAEGRMALADTLALAGKEKPTAIIDFATLTGTCVAALTDRYSGAFSNRDSLHDTLIQAGRTSGERVWPFPLDDDFAQAIDSEVADILQCAAGGGGDHIQAAKFLQRFVPATANWVHIDLSAATRKGGLAHIPTTVTGFGVRYALCLMMDYQDQLNAATRS